MKRFGFNSVRFFVFVVLSFTLMCLQTKAQTWCKTIGDNTGAASGYSIIQTSDNGFAITGTGFAMDQYTGDLYVLKTDQAGKKQWAKNIGGSNAESGQSIIQLPDHGYVIAGTTQSFGAGQRDVYVVRLDENGNLLWAKTYGGPYDDMANSIIKTNDGALILTGTSWFTGEGDFDLLVMKIDYQGNVIWIKDFQEHFCFGSIGAQIINTLDGGYAIAGTTNLHTTYGNDISNFYLVKLDVSGNLQWSKHVGGFSFDNCYGLAQLSDGAYVMCGSTYYYGAGYSDAYVVKINSSLNVEWAKTIGGTGIDFANSVIQIPDGGLALIGSTNSYGTGQHVYNIYIFKLVANGNLVWSNTYGRNYFSVGYSLINTNDGYLAVTGYATNYGSGSDIFFAKVNPDGSVCNNCVKGGGGITNSGFTDFESITTVHNVTSFQYGSGGTIASCGIFGDLCTNSGIGDNSENPEDSFSFYPVPFTDHLNLSYRLSRGGEFKITFLDLAGKEVHHQVCKLVGDEGSIPLEITFLKDGFYCVRISELSGQGRVYQIKLMCSQK